jgi:hypothetical protein
MSIYFYREIFGVFLGSIVFKNRGLAGFRQGYGICASQRPDALRGELVLPKELTRVPRTARRMPDQRNPNSDAERSQIQYGHDKSKQIHSHQQSDCGVHCQNANQPKESRLLDPNENRIADLDQAD